MPIINNVEKWLKENGTKSPEALGLKGVGLKIQGPLNGPGQGRAAITSAQDIVNTYQVLTSMARVLGGLPGQVTKPDGTTVQFNPKLTLGSNGKQFITTTQLDRELKDLFGVDATDCIATIGGIARYMDRNVPSKEAMEHSRNILAGCILQSRIIEDSMRGATIRDDQGQRVPSKLFDVWYLFDKMLGKERVRETVEQIPKEDLRSTRLQGEFDKAKREVLAKSRAANPVAGPAQKTKATNVNDKPTMPVNVLDQIQGKLASLFKSRKSSEQIDEEIAKKKHQLGGVAALVPLQREIKARAKEFRKANENAYNDAGERTKDIKPVPTKIKNEQRESKGRPGSDATDLNNSDITIKQPERPDVKTNTEPNENMTPSSSIKEQPDETTEEPSSIKKTAVHPEEQKSESHPNPGDTSPVTTHQVAADLANKSKEISTIIDSELKNFLSFSRPNGSEIDNLRMALRKLSELVKNELGSDRCKQKISQFQDRIFHRCADWKTKTAKGGQSKKVINASKRDLIANLAMDMARLHGMVDKYQAISKKPRRLEIVLLTIEYIVESCKVCLSRNLEDKARHTTKASRKQEAAQSLREIKKDSSKESRQQKREKLFMPMIVEPQVTEALSIMTKGAKKKAKRSAGQQQGLSTEVKTTSDKKSRARESDKEQSQGSPSSILDKVSVEQAINRPLTYGPPIASAG